jgi:hypothetical protein
VHIDYIAIGTIGSLVISCAAAVFAAFTWQENKKMASTASQQFSESVKPVLIHEDWQADFGGMSTNVTGGFLRNIGNGTAFDIVHTVTTLEGGEDNSMTLHIPPISLLPKGIKTTQGLWFHIPRKELVKDKPARGHCILICTYKDELGNCDTLYLSNQTQRKLDAPHKTTKVAVSEPKVVNSLPPSPSPAKLRLPGAD